LSAINAEILFSTGICLDLLGESYKLTRNSAIADKPRDAFRGQSRSPDMVPFDVRYDFILVCYSNAIVTLSVMCTALLRYSTSKMP